MLSFRVAVGDMGYRANTRMLTCLFDPVGHNLGDDLFNEDFTEAEQVSAERTRRTKGNIEEIWSSEQAINIIFALFKNISAVEYMVELTNGLLEDEVIMLPTCTMRPIWRTKTRSEHQEAYNKAKQEIYEDRSRALGIIHTMASLARESEKGSIEFIQGELTSDGRLRYELCWLFSRLNLGMIMSEGPGGIGDLCIGLRTLFQDSIATGSQERDFLYFNDLMVVLDDKCEGKSVLDMNVFECSRERGESKELSCYSKAVEKLTKDLVSRFRTQADGVVYLRKTIVGKCLELMLDDERSGHSLCSKKDMTEDASRNIKVRDIEKHNRLLAEKEDLLRKAGEKLDALEAENCKETFYYFDSNAIGRRDKLLFIGTKQQDAQERCVSAIAGVRKGIAHRLRDSWAEIRHMTEACTKELGEIRYAQGVSREIQAERAREDNKKIYSTIEQLLPAGGSYMETPSVALKRFEGPAKSSDELSPSTRMSSCRSSRRVGGHTRNYSVSLPRDFARHEDAYDDRRGSDGRRGPTRQYEHASGGGSSSRSGFGY